MSCLVPCQVLTHVCVCLVTTGLSVCVCVLGVYGVAHPTADFWGPALITGGVVALVVVVAVILGGIGFFVWKRQQRSIYDRV